MASQMYLYFFVYNILSVVGIPLLLKGIHYHGFETEYFTPLGLMDQNLNDILDVIKVPIKLIVRV